MLHNEYFSAHTVHMKVPVTGDGVLLYDYLCEMVYVRCISILGKCYCYLNRTIYALPSQKWLYLCGLYTVP